VPDSLFHNYTGGIYEDITGDTKIDHEVAVVGYGEENREKYWLVRNSWGTWWGENGFFRVVRGKNNIMIESDCVYALPKDTWTKKIKHKTTQIEKNDPNNETKNSHGGDTPELLKLLHKNSEFLKYDSFKELNHKCRRSDPRLSPGERRFTKAPWEYNTDFTKLPEQWDCRNVNGTNFASIIKNQHIPIFCGSCWAHGTTSALADRFQILNGAKSQPISLSPQVVVNCQPGGGSCYGGNPLDVYEFAFTHGIPDDTCQKYISYNSEVPFCSPMQVCQDCLSPVPNEGEDGRVRCHPVKKYKNYYVKEYGRVSGAHNMKMEIFKRGPIDCGIEVTPEFHAYTGGIYKEHISTMQ
jgi:cathepsin X